MPSAAIQLFTARSLCRSNRFLSRTIQTTYIYIDFTLTLMVICCVIWSPQSQRASSQPAFSLLLSLVQTLVGVNPLSSALTCPLVRTNSKGLSRSTSVTISPLPSALTNCDARKFFRIRSYAKHGGVTLSFFPILEQGPNRIRSLSFQMLRPYLPTSLLRYFLFSVVHSSCQIHSRTRP